MKIKAIYLSLILIFAFSTVKAKAENLKTNSDIQLPQIIYSKNPDLIDISSIDTNKYIVITKFEKIEINSISNLHIINFKGKVNLIYQDKSLLCNSLTVTISSNRVKEVIGEGNIYFKSGKDLFKGSKFFYDIESGQISFYEVSTKLDDQYFFADIMKQINENKFFFENVFFTKSDLLMPTYKVNAYRVWYYRGDYLLALNNTYYVGNSSFLYFPTYIELYRYTDIFTDFGVEKTLGFYLFNTIYLKDWVGNKIIPNLKLKLDHYEKLGEYVGFEIPKVNLISNLNLSLILNFEYDKKFEMYNNNLINYIDQYGTGEFKEYRTFGWHYLLNLSYNLSGVNLSFYSENLNDPYLPSKFSVRKEKLDIERLIFPDQNYFWSIPGTKQYITRNLKINYTYGISSLGINFDWIYQLRSGYSTTNTNTFGVIIIENKTNKYDNSYYRYDLQRFSGPTVSFSISPGSIFSYKKDTFYLSQKVPLEEGKFTKFKTNSILKSTNSFLINLFTINTNYSTNISQISKEGETSYTTNVIEYITTNTTIPTNLIKSNTFNVQKNKNEIFSTNTFNLLSFSLSPSANISLTPDSTYRIEDGTPIEDNFVHTENIGISASASVLNNIVSLSSSASINNNAVWSRTTNIYQIKLNDLNTRASLNLNSSISIGNPILDKTIFKTEPKFYVSHGISFRLTRPKLLSYQEDPYIDDITSHSISGNVSIKILDLSILSNNVLNFLGITSIIASTGLNYNLLYLKSEINYINDKYYWTNKISNPFTINFSFGPLLNYGVSYKIKVSNDNIILDSTRVSLFGGISVKEISLNSFIQKISYINLGYSISFDYINPINNNLILNLSTGGIINDYWSFSISTSIVNTKLYRYVESYALRYNKPYINIFQDIIDAVNIFDINALKRTSFKNKGITFSLIHDLYDWTATISGGIRLYRDDVKNFAFFEPFIKFEVKSKRSIGIEVPPIEPELYKLFQ
ncbi:MAG: hypothetical protein ACPL4C_01050 [Brevinematia bacterium]